MFKPIILFFIAALLVMGKWSFAREINLFPNSSNNTPTLVIPTPCAPETLQLKQKRGSKLLHLLQSATSENKKVTAAVLTLTLGMLGVHRIYLGTAPYIPAVYLFTFGGGFFILPIIDLVMILTTNDIAQFENNNKLLMWTGE